MPTKSVVDRSSSGKMVMRIFAHWKLSREEMLDVLGYSKTEQSILSTLQHTPPISLPRETVERIGHILNIHKNLRILFSHNRDLAYSWMKIKNRAFDDKTPVEVIREYGDSGVLMVCAYLGQVLGQ